MNALASAAGTPADQVAEQVRAACAAAGEGPACRLVSQSLQQVARGVGEYTFTLQVGRGVHDRIAVHRVVHEAAPGQPSGTTRAAFFVHGDTWGFDPAFAGELGLAKRAPNVATYLADRGLDVWGIDMRWVLVPPTVTTTAFMKDWGFATEVADLRLATTFERIVRGPSAVDSGRTAMVGWSRGAELAYAYADLESQLKPAERNVDALVPIDMVLNYAPGRAAFQGIACSDYRSEKAELASGDDAVALAAVAAYGQVALSNPNGPSAAAPGFTNRQLALYIGSFSHADLFTPWFHYVAGPFNGRGVPRGLIFTPQTKWFRFLSQAAPFESLATRADGDRLQCGKDTPFANHLSDIKLPVLYVGAAGGFGAAGIYSTTLLGSRDVSTLIVRQQPRGDEDVDFGHVDLWQARQAPGLVWHPLLSWLLLH